MTKKYLGLLLVAATLVTTGLGCNATVAPKPASAKPVTLQIWGVYDDVDAYADAFKAYQALHPNVSFDYRKFRPSEYDQELLNAFAEDRGPDIYMVQNTQVRANQAKLQPMPASTKTAYREIQGVNKNPVWIEKTSPSLTITQVKNLFIDQVGRDVIINAPTAADASKKADQVFALPLAVDTLALYYNKDALNAAGIPTPAQSWTELQDHVKRLTKYDSQGKLQRPAVGLGTFNNVNRAFDIISLLMMQDGTPMTDESGFPTFQRTPPDWTHDVPPGEEAITFYTDFANPTKDVFTWDDAQPNSLDAFIAGQTAYYFGYAYDLPTIRSQAPKLNFGITTVPQIDPANQKNYANYWAFGVAKKSKNGGLAWNLVQFLAAEAQAKTYLAKTTKPTALRKLIPEQLTNGDLGPFASQLLTAKSWYQGMNQKAAESAFADLVRDILAGTEAHQALNTASEVVAQTMQ